MALLTRRVLLGLLALVASNRSATRAKAIGRISALAAVFTATTLTAVAQTSASVSAKVQAARKLLAQGQTEPAARALAAAISDNPQDGPAHLLLGEMLNDDNRSGEAIEPLTDAVRLLPNSAEAHNALGEAFSNLNSLGPARSEFEKAVQLAPKMPLAHLNLGMVLAQTEELALAAEHLDFAIAKLGATPDAARAHYLRAKVYTDTGQVERASAELHIAVKIAPEFAEAWSDLGDARKTLLDHVGALAAFERAVALSPSDPVALSRLGNELYHQGQRKRAIIELEKAARISPKDQTTLKGLLVALRADGQTARADQVKADLVAVLSELHQGQQNELGAIRLNNEGAKLDKAGDLIGAVDKYRQGLQLDPDDVGIRIDLAVALLRLGQWKEGLAQMAEAMKRRPGDPILKAAWDDALRQAPPGSWP
jgi:Flp pilus assembly protein TadD